MSKLKDGHFDEASYNLLLEYLKFDFSRKTFVDKFSEVSHVTEIHPNSFNQLVEVVNTTLRNITPVEDFSIVRRLLNSIFLYCKIEQGAEDFIYVTKKSIKTIKLIIHNQNNQKIKSIKTIKTIQINQNIHNPNNQIKQINQNIHN